MTLARKTPAQFILLFLLSAFAFAEGTRTWEQSKLEELVKGTAKGVAFRSEGGLELAPSFKTLTTTPSTYIWSIAADGAGNIYAAAGAPARIYRITPDGKTETIFEPQELQVQALVVAKDGSVFAATAPDGKVYRLAAVKTPPASDKAAARGPANSNWSASVYFDPGAKYIWDLALNERGDLFVATGDHGEIFRVSSSGQHSLFFKSDEVHIRVLAFDPQGNLIAGSDGSGLIYRIAPNGEAFVLYSAPKKEITALAIDSAGNIYAAGAGEKRPESLGPPSLNITVAAPAPTGPVGAGGPGAPPPTLAPAPPAQPFPAPGAGATGGSEIYRITPDGAPAHLWSSREDLVYALGFDRRGRLIAGSGNRGHIFAVNGVDDFADLVKAGASQITGFAPAPDGGLYASSSNLGKVFVLGPGPEPEGSYESDVFDARVFSQWGRARVRSSGAVEFYARSGNVDNPDRNWSPWTRVDLAGDAELKIPQARFAQWKAVLRFAPAAGGRKAGLPESALSGLDSVLLFYLPKNVAPQVDEVIVQPGFRYQPIPHVTGMESQAPGQPRFDPPPPAVRDRDSVGIRWLAHDDNDDQLVYSIYYRGDGETRWLLLKDDLSDRYYSFDASLLPDGGYTVMVVASDAPSHSPGEGLFAQKVAARFEVDNTPPAIENLGAVLEGGQIRVRFRAADSFSHIKRAEFSLDGSDWQFVEPAGKLSDAKAEDYDFQVSLPPASAPPPPVAASMSGDHIVIVRVYDRFDNLATGKAVVRAK